ncbi:MAG: methyltransferase domain-containing protein [Chloroflexi bacterium]|nr:methyltransferase domain-containing protein [Chloroflexota bacterium]
MTLKTPTSTPDQSRKLSQRARSARSAFGQVARLEEHVSPDWWAKLFNSNYILTDHDMIEDPEITSAETDMFVEALKIEPDHTVLDLACGQGRHALELAHRGFTGVEGLDRSRYLIQRARRAARAAGDPVRFREGDARRLPYPTDNFDRVMLVGNSFGYFQTAEDDLKLLREVGRVLKPGGRFLVDVVDANFVRNNLVARSWEWISPHQFVCRERSLTPDRQTLTSREMISDISDGVIEDQFYSERLYDRADLQRELTEVGFAEIQFHGEHAPQSDKAQDTGMMGHRIVMTGLIEKQWSPSRNKAVTAARKVFVIQGDPRRSDTVKPGGVWDQDDFETISLLKSAMAQIEGTKTSYLDNHATLQADLLKRVKPGDLVLNLCDEGYRNDARLELHVPAMLEILNLDYTGAAPQCLAYCYDKSLVRGAAREIGIPVAEGVFVSPDDLSIDLPFDFPVIVKPNSGDSSIGITQNSVAFNKEEVIAALAEVRKRLGADRPVLVEQFLTGKDLSLGIIGNLGSGFRILPATEEDYSAVPPELPRICGYEAKWDPGSPYWNIVTIKADLPEETHRKMSDASMRLFERLGCRDYARFDWRLDADGTPRLLEVNPNPGWCWDGHLAKMCLIAGVSYPTMLTMIVEAAERRLGSRPSEPDQYMSAVREKTSLELLRSF